jgi:peptide/nickel transport system permease protein
VTDRSSRFDRPVRGRTRVYCVTMLRFLARRLAFSALLVAVVSSSALVLTSLAPGDITSEQVGSGVTAEVLAAERARLGLDRSVLVQYGEWLGRAVRFDFGMSLMYGRPVGPLVAERACNTAMLAFVALAVATLVGLPLGVIAGSRGGAVSLAIRALSVLMLSLPSLVSSLLLVFVAARTGWLPSGGMTSMASSSGGSVGAVTDLLRHLVVPAAALALPLAATLERLQAQATEETMREPYVAAAYARGVSRGRVIWRDALKPSLRPVAAIYGLICGSLLSGSFVVEIVTAWPGLGRLMFDALRSRDLYLVAGCTAAAGVFLALGSLASDLALAAVDPRLRSQLERRT